MIRATLNISTQGARALERLTADGTNKTDAINRALRVAALVEDLAEDGALTVVRGDGTRERIHLL
ncbi:MAG TPA: hypothetical protein VFR23_04620 [Jiangellaceae bacterium]|nr:hypothetical protein [Jiangellaceae bacterium]